MNWTELRAVRSFVARHPLVIACGLSLVVHFTLFEGWRLGKRLGWWEHQATWLLDLKKKVRSTLLQPPVTQVSLAPAQREIPLTFVEVDPSLATPEPPKDAKYYSSQSTRAANPDPVVDTTVPKIDGQQTKVVRTEDVPKPSPQPLQPAPQPDKPPEPLQPKPKGGETPGDLAKAKPEDLKPPKDGQADLGVGSAAVVPRERPRTLAAARQQRMLAGEKMQQEGGAKKRGPLSLNVTTTPFGSYDAALIAAIQQRWYDLFDNFRFAARSGKVILEFRLYYDGSVRELKIDGN